MSEIKRFDIPRNGNEFMHEDPDGEYVQYDDHLAEVLRMRAEVRRLTGDLSYTIDRCRALELSVEQADELKAHAEAAAAWEKAKTDRLMSERDLAQAEVERLRGDIQLLAREIAVWKRRFRECDEDITSAKARAEEAIAERDAAQAEVERLREEANRLANSMVGRVMAERDLANAEVARLRTEVERLTREIERAYARAEVEQQLLQLGPPQAGRQWLRAKVEQLTVERDAALAEVNRLKGDRGQAEDGTTREGEMNETPMSTMVDAVAAILARATRIQQELRMGHGVFMDPLIEAAQELLDAMVKAENAEWTRTHTPEGGRRDRAVEQGDIESQSDATQVNDDTDVAVVEGLSQALDAAQAEQEQLRAEVERLRADVERLIAERDELDWKLGIRRQESGDLLGKVLTLRGEQTKAQAEVERLTAERDAAQAEQEQLRAEVARLTAKRDDARVALDLLEYGLMYPEQVVNWKQAMSDNDCPE